MSPSTSPLAALGGRLREVAATRSTMDDAMAWAARGAPTGAVVWAREQTAGRGRWQRPWVSPRGGLWFSYVWRLAARPPPRVWELVPLAAGVALADALERATGLPVRLKWPNDLFVRGKKVGGLLVEATVGAEHVAVVGVGVNANVDLAALPGDARLPSTTLRAETGRDWPLDGLLAAAVASLDLGFTWLVSNPAMVLAAYRSRCETLGKRVAAELSQGVVEGTAVEIGDDGSLLVDGPGGRVAVHADECRHLS